VRAPGDDSHGCGSFQTAESSWKDCRDVDGAQETHIGHFIGGALSAD
jgi:hypothetical protein